MAKFKNIYTILEEIEFEKECKKHSEDCKKSPQFYDMFLLANFMFSIVQKFYGKVLDNADAPQELLSDKIYVISNDGHRDSINLENYATNEAEIIKLITDEEEGIYGRKIVGEFKIDYDKELVTYKVSDFDDDEAYEKTYHIFTLKKDISYEKENG